MIRRGSPRLALLVSSALLVASVASAAEPAAGSPSERVDRLFAEWDRSDSPGCALGIIDDGKWFYRRGYGMADLEHGIPLTSGTVMRIGSTSKQFTAMAVLLLEHQGRLSLDDDIRKYLPELPDYGEPIRISDLLYHTSGIRHYLTLLEMQGLRPRDGATPAEALDLLARQEALNFRPGERYQSSDSGYFLLSVIAARASGQSLREYAEENIFRPLGMAKTHFHDDLTHVVPDRADGYSRLPEGGYRIDMEHGIDVVGDGGVLTTVEDLFLWDQNFYASRLEGGQPLIERFLRPGTTEGGETLSHAAGVLVEHYRGLPAVHYSGGWVGFVSYMIRFPTERFSVICLCNLNDIRPWHLARSIADIYLKDAFTEPKRHREADPARFVHVPATELARRVGFYENADARQVWQIILEGEALVAEDGDTRYALRPVSSNEFHSVNTPYVVRFEFADASGTGRSTLRVARMGLDYYLEPADGGAVTLEALEPVTLAPAEMEEYVGTYASDELGTRYHLVQDGGSLYIRNENPHRSSFRGELVPIGRDRLRAAPVLFTFVRDADGRVAAARVDDRHYVWSLKLARVPSGSAEASPAAGRSASDPAYAARSARVDALFARYSATRSPGCAVGIVDGGRPVHRGAYGYANLDYDIPLSADSVFRIASVSKQFTAVAVALLAEDGLLRLDDPVGRYLPELHADMQRVTIRQLLGHTGGVPDYEGEGWDGLLESSAGGPFRFGNQDYLTTGEFFEVTTHLQPLFPPGERFAYSNIGYFWLSQIVERVSGESLRTFAKRRIFDPVGMKASFFNDDVNTIVPNRATGYAVLPDGGYEVFETNLDWIGDGGVYTTVNDFFLWDAQFGRPTIGANPEALRRQLVSPIGEEESFGPYRIRHALGLWLAPEDAEEPVVWHPGSWVGFKALYKRFPERDFAYFVFCNREDVDRQQLASEIEAIYAPE